MQSLRDGMAELDWGSINDGGYNAVTSFSYPLTGLVSCLAIIIVMWTGIKVGQARAKYQVPAPATTGPDEFCRVYRVQMNTVEQAVIYFPLLWLFAVMAGDGWGAAFGAIWPVGRVMYARAYYADAEKRGAGFGVTFLSTALLLVGSLYELIKNIL
jgi:glutathione S-transferase